MKAITPQEYYDRIKDLRTPLEIKELCDRLTSDLFNEADKPKTRVNKLIPYNKLINSLPGDELVEGETAYIQTKADGSLWKRHLHFQFTGLADTNWHGEGGINTKTIVLDRLENCREVKVNEYLETVSKLLLSDDPHELAVGLIAASGRRPIEILVRGSFAIASDIPNYLTIGYFVNFKGQAKKRDYEMPVDERADYRIGVLVPADGFLAAFKRFRNMPETKELLGLLKTETKKGTDPESINDKIEGMRGNSLRRVVAREFANFLPARFGDSEINNKSLRAVYVRLITDRDCPKNIADILWASRSVGHFIDTQKPDDSQLRHLLTTLGYFDYYANTEVPFIAAPQKTVHEKPAPVRAFESDAEVIKQLQKDWELPSQMVTIRNLIELATKAKELEAQLLETQAQITQLQQEKLEMQSIPPSTPQSIQQSQQQSQQPQTQDLQAMVKQMVALALAEALPQIQQLTPNIQQPTPNTQVNLATGDTPRGKVYRQPKAKPETPEKDWESVTSEELKASKHRGAAEEKIKRSFIAIANHNDHKARDNNGQPDIKQMWSITNQALRQVSGCNGQLVRDWMELHHGAIDDHNAKHGLGQYHNKGKGDITQVVNW
jgi:Telomere resolvase